MNRLAKHNADKTYRAKQNLLANIHKAIAPVLADMRKADAILDNCTKGRPATGINETETDSLAKYGNVYTLRPCSQLGDLSGANNELAGAAYMAGLDKGETTTRNIADNN